jgi:hypothetical protein
MGAMSQSKSKTAKTKKKGPTPKAGAPKKTVEKPEPKGPRPTPLYVPVAAIGSIVTGLIVIILSFLEILPQAPQPQYNVVGLVFMSVGFVLATQIK